MALTQKPLIFLMIALWKVAVVLWDSMQAGKMMALSLKAQAFLLRVSSASVSHARRISGKEKIFTCTGRFKFKISFSLFLILLICSIFLFPIVQLIL